MQCVEEVQVPNLKPGAFVLALSKCIISDLLSMIVACRRCDCDCEVEKAQFLIGSFYAVTRDYLGGST